MSIDPMTIKVFKQIELFLNEIDQESDLDIQSLLQEATQNKEYLDAFFKDQLSQLYNYEFNAEQGSSSSIYIAISLNDEIYKDNDQKDRMKEIVKMNLNILINLSDYLHQDYIEIPQSFAKFVFEVFPNYLRLLQIYFKRLGFENHYREISSIGGKWNRIFDKKKYKNETDANLVDINFGSSVNSELVANILTQNWSLVQNLINRSSTIRWSLRAGVIAGWWAIIYSSLENIKDDKFIFAIIIVIGGMFYEMFLKLGEDKLIIKSIEIENRLNLIAHGGVDLAIGQGIKISTTVNRRINLRSFKFMLQDWKFILWLPYIVIILGTICFWGFKIS